MIGGKLESALWFLKRPRLFPQLLHLLRLRFLSRPEPDTREQAERWCAQHAVSVGEAIETITGAKMEAPVSTKFARIFADAEARVKNCPVTMGGPGALDLLYWVARKLKARRSVETGVAYGWSSLAILLAQQEAADSLLISVDMPYLRANNDSYVGVAVPEQLRAKWELIRLSDRQAVPGALRRLETIDLCHYDSDKTYAGRLWAYPRLWAALRPGGCFISDDINDNLGFRDFAHKLGLKPIVVRVDSEKQVKYVGILNKS